MFVWNKIPTQSYSAKFLYWGDHVNSVPGLAASPPGTSNDNKKKSRSFLLVCVYIHTNLHFATKTIVVHDLSLLSTVMINCMSPKSIYTRSCLCQLKVIVHTVLGKEYLFSHGTPWNPLPSIWKVNK